MRKNDMRSIAVKFSSAASYYHDHATLQQQIAEQLLESLDVSPRRILELGCGTGFLTRSLQKYFPRASVHAVDLCAPMVDVARSSVAKASLVKWSVGDARELTFPVPYDLVLSSSALHWMGALDGVFSNLRKSVTPGGKLAFSIMLHGTLEELRTLRLEIAPGKAPRADLPQARAVRWALAEAGFELLSWRQQHYEEHYPNAETFLRNLHDLGLTAGALSQAAHPLQRGELRELTKEYNKRFSDKNGNVYASYEVGYFYAERIQQYLIPVGICMNRDLLFPSPEEVAANQIGATSDHHQSEVQREETFS